MSTCRRWARPRLFAGAAVALTALLAGLLAAASPAFAAAFVPISGAGSTWSFNAINGWATNEAANAMTVNYSPVGSVSGLSDFANGIVDWAASEIPYGVQAGGASFPPPTRGYTYIPDTAGGVAFMYNLHVGGQLVTNLRLSGAVIAGIFTNQITMWNDPKIAADNPDLTLPAERIVPVVRSDASGSTQAFTQWMVATQSSAWTAYCAVVGVSPCTETLAYPVQAGTTMIGQAGDLGVSGYVSQPAAEGAIGYTEYAYALQTGFPVAKVLNAAGYYTAPTADNVGVSLLQAQVNTDTSSVLYQTADLSGVYTDTDPRTYELSYYSYLVVPTDLTAPMTSAKGLTLGAFGQYALCQGQQTLDALGYASLPINLVEDGFTQLQKVPGNNLPATTADFIGGCANPTFAPDGTDTLARDAPNPPACDQQGPSQCTTAAGGLVSTAVALTASPSPVAPGAEVTLTATESAADGTTPAGTVQFGVGATDIGPAVAVSAAGVATTTTTFAATGIDTVWALFLPTSLTYSTSEATLPVTVTTTAGAVPLLLTVPPIGTLTVTVAAGPVNLTAGTSTPVTATGTLQEITVADTRNYVPGWSVSGQESAFTGSGAATGSTISGDQLGWVPVAIGPLVGGAALGPVVGPGTSPGGLGDTAAVLADADAGSGLGANTLTADLTLDIPAAALAGPYGGQITITYLETGPQVAGTIGVGGNF